MVKAFLTNMGYYIYEGNSLYEAMDKVEAAGFEATIYNPFDDTTLEYSPIGGWRLI